ncbi:hypothetical protein QVD17_00924 [Tagetes erecta]|uniref:non-specific serine/threonine protein kinase n=1 Tax=Tagetes erecta TaxID=13708 RepID=A0AAD8L415_TARER|nr:hypothetical protein QVD17_00924 [Tagetes erecta]
MARQFGPPLPWPPQISLLPICWVLVALVLCTKVYVLPGGRELARLMLADGVVVGRAWTGSNHVRAHRRRGWTVTRGRGWNGWVTAAVKGDGAQFFDRWDEMVVVPSMVDVLGDEMVDKKGPDRPMIDFTSRHRIAIGCAKGLAYLHEECTVKIIDRDIKSAIILLGFNCEAIVADFDMSKMHLDDIDHVIASRVIGTQGSLTNSSRQISTVILISTDVTSQEVVDPWLRGSIHQALETGNYSSVVDGTLGTCYNREEMNRLLECASLCVFSVPVARPRMSLVVKVLEGTAAACDLKDGLNPRVYNFLT